MNQRIKQAGFFLLGAVLLVVGAIVLLPVVVVVLALALVGAGVSMIVVAMNGRGGVVGGNQGRQNVRVLVRREDDAP